MHNSLFLSPEKGRSLPKKGWLLLFAPAKTKIIYCQECTREWQVKKKVLSLLLQNNYHFTRIFFRLRNIFYKLRFYNRLKNLSFAQNFMADQKWLILERSENRSFLGISAMATLVIKFWTFKLILRYTFYKLRFYNQKSTTTKLYCRPKIENFKIFRK